MSSTSQLQSATGATGATGSHHHPPLSSLVHPHLHTILHIAQDHGLPSPQWTATTPDEKRSLSSDKTITPSSTMKTPQASLQVPSGVPQPNTSITSASIEDVTAGIAHLGRSATGSSPLAFSSSPDSHGWSSEQHHQQTWSTSPATEKSQPEWPQALKHVANTTQQSPASLLAQHNRRETKIEGSSSISGSNGGNIAAGQITRHKTENELWIEISDALTVVADALKEEHMREPLGNTSLVIHLLTLFSLSITYDHAPRPQIDPAQSSAPSGSRHSRSKSAESTASSSSSSSQQAVSTDSINGINLAQIQCLRTLANLCIDDDDNRTHLLQHDAPLFVLTLVKKTLSETQPVDGFFEQSTLTLLKTAMGALINLQLDHAEARAWLLRLPKPRRNHHPHEDGGHRHPHHHPHRPVSHHINGAAADKNSHLSVPVPGSSLHDAASESRYVVNSPFELDESDTLRILLAVATDPRVYPPSMALRSILGPRVGEFEAEDYLEDEGEGEDRIEWAPPHNRWSDVELGAQVTAWSARIMEDLLTFETDEVRASQDDDDSGSGQTEAALLPSLSRSALAADPNTWEFLLRTLLAFVPTRNKFHSDSSPVPLVGEHRGFATNPATYPEDASAMLDADLTLVALCGELLEGCSHISKGRDANARLFKRSGVARLPDLLDFIENGTSPLGTNTSPLTSRLERFELEPEDVSSLSKEVGRAKANAVKAVVAIASEDANMAALFGRDVAADSSPSFLSRMKEWLQFDHRKREDIVSCALLSIANLARSDENCMSLAYEHDLVPHLVSIMQGMTEKDGADNVNGTSDGDTPRSRGAGSMLLAHATLGLLKNLSIPVKNKSLIGKSGLLSRLAPFISREKDQAQPIQFGAIGIAKHLSFAGPSALKGLEAEDVAGSLVDNAVEICGMPRAGGDTANDECLLTSLLELIERTEDTPTRLEATRVLVNLIRTLWSVRAQQQLSEGRRSVIVSRQRLASKQVINALCEMFKRSGKFAVLLNEALVGLALLTSSGGEGGEHGDSAPSTSSSSGTTLQIALALLGRSQNGDGRVTSPGGDREKTSSPDSLVDGSGGANGSGSALNGNHFLSPTGSTPDVRFPPSRSSTTDSSATNYSSTTVTASPETAADVLYDLLTSASISVNHSSAAVASSTPTSSESTAQAIGSGSSIKTFVPVQVAENGCALLRSLSVDGSEANKELCLRMLPALRGLKVRIGVVYGGRSGVVTTLSMEERQAAASSQKAVAAALEACEKASHRG